MDKAARIISILFHPLIMPSVGFLLLFNSGTYLAYLPFEYKKMILLIVFLCTFVIPLSILPFFLYHKIISDINMSGARERFAPLVINFILFVLCYFLLRKVPIPPDYPAFCLGSYKGREICPQSPSTTFRCRNKSKKLARLCSLGI